MLDIRELEYWISRYEKEADKLDQLSTLSALYSIRDRLQGDVRSAPQPQISAYSEASTPAGETLSLYGESDFLRAVAGLPAPDAWAVMDELMDTLQVVNPRTYDSVMRKLGRI